MTIRTCRIVPEIRRVVITTGTDYYSIRIGATHAGASEAATRDHAWAYHATLLNFCPVVYMRAASKRGVGTDEVGSLNASLGICVAAPCPTRLVPPHRKTKFTGTDAAAKEGKKRISTSILATQICRTIVRSVHVGVVAAVAGCSSSTRVTRRPSRRIVVQAAIRIA